MGEDSLKKRHFNSEKREEKEEATPARVGRLEKPRRRIKCRTTGAGGDGLTDYKRTGKAKMRLEQQPAPGTCLSSLDRLSRDGRGRGRYGERQLKGAEGGNKRRTGSIQAEEGGVAEPFDRS